MDSAQPSTPSFPPPTLPPLPPTNKELHPFVPILLIITLIALTTSAFLYFQNTKLQQKLPSSETSSDITPVATPTIDPTSDWPTYTNTKNGYSLKYPNDWVAKSVAPGPGEIALSPTSRGFTTYPSEYVATTSSSPRFSIEIFDPKQESVVGVSDFSSWVAYLKKNQNFTLTSESTTLLDDVEAVILDGSLTVKGKTSHHKRYLTHSQNVYFYISLEDIDNATPSEVFDQILSTFKFTAPLSITPSATSSAMYTCPASGWSDCMPSPDGVKPECTPQAQTWFKTNCPGYKGSAR